jgi:hypothetical protein
MGLHLIGYWRDDAHPEYPSPEPMVDTSWDSEERWAVASYFSEGTVLRTFMGLSPCRLCGQDNGAMEYTDGVLAWPEGLAHYIEEHSVRPPEAVVQHALARSARLEDEPVSLAWWLAGSPEPPPG